MAVVSPTTEFDDSVYELESEQELDSIWIEDSVEGQEFTLNELEDAFFTLSRSGRSEISVAVAFRCVNKAQGGYPVYSEEYRAKRRKTFEFKRNQKTLKVPLKNLFSQYQKSDVAERATVRVSVSSNDAEIDEPEFDFDLVIKDSSVGATINTKGATMPSSTKGGRTVTQEDINRMIAEQIAAMNPGQAATISGSGNGKGKTGTHSPTTYTDPSKPPMINQPPRDCGTKKIAVEKEVPLTQKIIEYIEVPISGEWVWVCEDEEVIKTGQSPSPGGIPGQSPPGMMKANTSVDLRANLNPIALNQTLDLTAIVTGLAGGQFDPTGKVEFFIDNNKVGEMMLDMQSRARISLPAAMLGAGNKSVVAKYSGDNSYNPSQSQVLVLMVGGQGTMPMPSPQQPPSYIPPYTPTPTPQQPPVGMGMYPTQTYLSANLNPVNAGVPLDLTASVTATMGGMMEATGKVSFFDGQTKIGEAMLDAQADALLTISTLTPGAHVITAKYEGDMYNAPSTSAPLTVMVSGSGIPGMQPPGVFTPVGNGQIIIGGKVYEKPIFNNGAATCARGTLAIAADGCVYCDVTGLPPLPQPTRVQPIIGADGTLTCPTGGVLKQDPTTGCVYCEIPAPQPPIPMGLWTTATLLNNWKHTVDVDPATKYYKVQYRFSSDYLELRGNATDGDLETVNRSLPVFTLPATVGLKNTVNADGRGYTANGDIESVGITFVPQADGTVNVIFENEGLDPEGTFSFDNIKIPLP